MVENSPHNSELEPERFPTLEEVSGQLRDLIGHDFTLGKKREDERGLYYLQVVVPSEKEGDFAEYEYVRQGEYQIGTFADTAIHVAEFSNNEYVSGTSLAKYIRGTWVRE